MCITHKEVGLMPEGVLSPMVSICYEFGNNDHYRTVIPLSLIGDSDYNNDFSGDSECFQIQ